MAQFLRRMAVMGALASVGVLVVLQATGLGAPRPASAQAKTPISCSAGVPPGGKLDKSHSNTDGNSPLTGFVCNYSLEPKGPDDQGGGVAITVAYACKEDTAASWKSKTANLKDDPSRPGRLVQKSGNTAMLQEERRHEGFGGFYTVSQKEFILYNERTIITIVVNTDHPPKDPKDPSKGLDDTRTYFSAYEAAGAAGSLAGAHAALAKDPVCGPVPRNGAVGPTGTDQVGEKGRSIPGTGVIVVTTGVVTIVSVGGLVIRKRRKPRVNVDDLPEECRGKGAELEEAKANVATLKEIDQELTEELKLRKTNQKKNLIKAALVQLVHTTQIVGSGAAEVAAARKAALTAGRQGLGVMEHWSPPSQLSPRLRAALDACEGALTGIRTTIEELRGKLNGLWNNTLDAIEKSPAVQAARTALKELEPNIKQAEEAVMKLLGASPGDSPRARLERAESLLNGIGDHAAQWNHQIDQLDGMIQSDRDDMMNIIKWAQTKGQPIDDWMKEYMELQAQMRRFETGELGSTLSPGFSKLLDRKKELDALGGKWDLGKAADLRRKMDLNGTAKAALEKQLKEHSDRVAKVMADHEKALVDVANLEAAEARLNNWKSQQTAAAKNVESAKDAANEAIQAEGKRLNEDLAKARAREKELLDQRADLRADAEIEQSLSSNASQTGFGNNIKSRLPEGSGPGILRRGLTITGEIIFGVEEQSAEEVGTILREADEYIRLTEARQRSIQKAITVEQGRVASLQQALDECLAHHRQREKEREAARGRAGGDAASGTGTAEEPAPEPALTR